MPRFRNIEFPKEAAERIEAAGGKPGLAWVWHKGVDVVTVLVSEDPSGPGRTMEQHASIAASTLSKRRMPRDSEVRHAAAAIGWSNYQAFQSNDCVHLYKG